MAALSAAQITVLAANAGFSGPDLQTAVAIALAESGGNPSIIGDRGNSFGLWQINIPAHPNYNGPSLLNPAANAAAAYAIYQAAGESFTPWSTYNNQAYLAYMPAAPAAPPASTVIDVGTADTIDSSVDTGDLVAEPTPAPAQSNILGNVSPVTLILLTAAGIGAFLILDFINGDD